jgi:uracil-DNA glycosylase
MDTIAEQDIAFTWDQLKWWDCGERQVIEERLDALEARGLPYNPNRSDLYAALQCCPYDETRVAIIGQDPYPQPKFCTGIAFSIPASLRKYPPTLELIYQELFNDLKIKRKNGSLENWCKQGVLLWNAIPSCLSGQPLSHDWTEYQYLTQEIVGRLAERGIVFAFLGGVARRYAYLVSSQTNAIIETGHPSPRANRVAKHPFNGSRLFSTINAKLTELGYEKIDWS